MLVEGYVLLQPEDMNGEINGTHHLAAGSYETEEQRLVSVDNQCLGCSGTRRSDAHIPPCRFVGYEAEQIRSRLERLRQAGADVCAGCAGRFAAW